ncbi:hypothetical protein KJ966_27000 [bacterium]|nr:hypothetical protein [bacterium]
MIPKHATLRVREALAATQPKTMEQFRKKKQAGVNRSARKCSVCGNSFLIPSGTCFVCQICGTSLGCS